MSWRLLLLRLVGAWMRRGPSHPGKWRLIPLAVALAPSLRNTTVSRVVTVRDGLRLRVDGSSQTGRILFATGTYEEETTDIIEKLLEPGDTMIDVGANIGYFSLVAGRRVGPQGHVVAFEPVSQVRQRLTLNLQLNLLSNVVVRGEALSDRNGRATFFVGPTGDTGLASLRPLESSQSIEVEEQRFDEIWDASRRVALVKMDVEGGELGALSGMVECLSRDRPDVVVEITDAYLRGLGASADALFDFLTSRGFVMYQIGAHLRLTPVSTKEELRRCPDQFNALFTAKRDITQRLETSAAENRQLPQSGN